MQKIDHGYGTMGKQVLVMQSKRVIRVRATEVRL